MVLPVSLSGLILKFRSRLNFQPGQQIILALSLAGVLIHLLFFQNLGFHRDELLYFSLGEYPDLGYFSVPPLIGLIAKVLTTLFGYTLFAARILPAIVGGVMVYLVALIAKELKGSLFSQFLAQLGLICSILFLRTFSMYQPVFLDLFFWTLTLYFLLRYINTSKPYQLYFLGIAVGFGILNKYNILFLILALLLTLPFTRLKYIFSKKEFYVALLLVVIVVSPNLVWQIIHHLPVLSHLSELRKSQLEKMSSVNFLIEQLLMVYPATILALPGLLYLLVNRQVREFRWVGISLVLVLILYLLLHGKSYYSAGIYPLLIASGAVFCEKFLRKSIWRITIVLVLLLVTWSALPMGLASKSPEKLVSYFDKMAQVTHNDAVRRYENNQYYKLPQDYADMLGWDELTALTNQAWQLVRQKDHCIIYAENYGQAGAISILGKKYNLPQPISFSDNFRYWIPKSLDTEITEFIYINDKPGADIYSLFGEIIEIGRISNPLAREFGTGVFLCRNPKSSFNDFWLSRIK